MRTLSRITCAVLAGTALFGVVGLASTATAAPARPLGATATVIGVDEVSTSATRAFWIENRTSEGITVYGLAGAGDVLLPEDSLPENRYIGPGQTRRVEVTSGYFSNGGHQVEVSLIGDKTRWTAPRDVPAYGAGPGGECGDRGGPVEDCHGYTLPPQPYYAGARLVLNVWGFTRTSHVMSSSFGPILAGGEAIVITEAAGTSTVPASS